jgi:hypothetical protein
MGATVPIVEAMDLGFWQPSCERPCDLVAPVPVDPTGRRGPTPKQARGPRFRTTSSGLFVPATVTDDRVEQRILEQAGRLKGQGAVSAWAALRWRGAAFFTGRTWDGSPLPVPLVLGPVHRRPDPRVSLTNEQVYPREIENVDGIRCMVPVRALFDEVRRVAKRNLREAVVAADMASAAGLLTIEDFREYVAARTSWTGVPVAREAVALASDGSRSPQETRLRLVWVLEAGLAPPLCNVPVYDRTGRLIGIPDLFEPEAGLAGEYAGAAHRDASRHRRDVVREADFRDHGIECVTVVEGELNNRYGVAQRLRAAYDRARFLSPDRRSWTLESLHRPAA